MIPIAKIIMSDLEVDSVVEILRSGNLREGVRCREFEKKFAEMVGTGYATTVANGSLALLAAYMTVIKPGDEVIVPSFTFFATASMVAFAGGIPVFCDIDPKNFTMDVNDFKSKITSKTRAVAPVHLFGNACDIDGIVEIAKKHKLHVIWDAAQAHLTAYKGRDIGSFCDAVCYSFYATKNMTTGEGGMITSDNKDLIDHCNLLKRQGQSKKYYHTVLGTNFRMTDLQAAIGLVQMQRLPDFTKKRRCNAAFLSTHLKNIKGIKVPYKDSFVDHAYHLYTVLLDLENIEFTRDDFIERLREKGVEASINYPVPLHRQPVFENSDAAMTGLPNAEWVSERCVSLPVHPFLGEKELDQIVAGVQEILN